MSQKLDKAVDWEGWLNRFIKIFIKLTHPIVLLLLSSTDLPRNIESCSLGGMDDHYNCDCWGNVSHYSYFSKIKTDPKAHNHIIMGELVRIILSNLGHRFLVLRQSMSQKFLCPMLWQGCLCQPIPTTTPTTLPPYYLHKIIQKLDKIYILNCQCFLYNHFFWKKIYLFGICHARCICRVVSWCICISWVVFRGDGYKHRQSCY